MTMTTALLSMQQRYIIRS